ncbi:MAG: hypothetical protein LC791_01320 [Acidobacteria bacterium]|nr:hypothetical protein [Acidobacteriota bacterium]
MGLAMLASTLALETVTASLLVSLLASVASAQTPASSSEAGSSRPFEILDNSFFVEEAFNQEPGIFQNITGLSLASGDEWELGFTQEWPVISQAHQFSYSVPVLATMTPGLGETQRGLGDVLVNYRYQALTEAPGRPAFSPRFSVVLPTGGESRGLGQGSAGLEINLPFSKQWQDVYWHWNAGFTLLPRAYAGEQPGETETRRESLLSPRLAGSAIYRVRPMFNLMLEIVAQFDETPNPTGSTDRDTMVLFSPGFRQGWNVGDQQLVFGLALPIILTDTDDRTSLFGYFSYELPFGR